MSTTKADAKRAGGDAPPPEEDQEMQEAARMAASFFERLERYEQQELLCWSSSNWLLSPEFKLPIEHPLGIVTNVTLAPEHAVHIVLLPVPDEAHQELDFKEVHQIIRELTVGIFGCNQPPQLALEANFDQSSSCHLPPAYVDTKVGQTMLAVDCAIKSLWHGAHMAKEKRVKFAERWRSTLTVNSATGKPETMKVILNEFLAAGITDVTLEEGYESVYASLPREDPHDPKLAKERKAFTDMADCMRMCLTLRQKSVEWWKNVNFVDADWTVTSQILLTEEDVDEDGYEVLNSRLQRQAEAIHAVLDKNSSVRRHLLLLKLISFLVPFFVGIKKRMRIPDLSTLLAPMIGDDVKTERELPPIIVSPEFRCKNFAFPANHYYSLHGGVSLDLETPEPKPATREISRAVYERIESEVADIRARADPDSAPQEHYPVGRLEIDGRRYYVIPIQLETFYPQQPQKPKWVRAMYDEIARSQPKKLPLQEAQLFEQFKKFFGQKKAIKSHKNLPGMKLCAQRGLQSMFFSLYRKYKNELNKQDESGLSLIHHAAVHNKPHIVTFLLHNSMDVNVRRHNTILSTGERNRTGPTALHLAARCGSLEVASCLLASYANVIVTDAMGWAAVHHGAYFNHASVLRLLIRKHEELLELLTKNSMRSTPILLAATSGALQSLLILTELGANRGWHDEEHNGVIELAAMNLHTNVLEQLIRSPFPDLPVWPTLVQMLESGRLEHMCSSVKCLICLSVSHESHWERILEAGGVPALVRLLPRGSESLELVRDATSVLRNISEHDRVKTALADAGAAPILIKLLSSGVDQILANTSLVLSDMACVDSSRALISELGGVAPLVAALMNSPAEDVRSNAVNALRVLCTGNSANQKRVAECGAVAPLVQFLQAGASEILQTNAAAALAAITKRNPENQELVLQANAVEPLVNLLKSRGNINVQVKAASAVEALSENNPKSQTAFIRLETDKALLKLLKVWSLDVKEQGALALWALAGATHVQQRAIAERIGIQQLIEILMTKSEKLQFVACVTLTALARDSVTRQNEVSKEGGLQPLVRIVKSPKSSQRVLLCAVQTLASLCVGVAHSNNPATQSRLAEEGAVDTLVDLLANSPVPEVQAEAAYTLGCLVLRNGDNQFTLKQQELFSYALLLGLLDSDSPKIRLRGCQALAVFAFNNTRQQFAIREAGGLSYRALEEFLLSADASRRCHAAFQTVVLTRDIVDADPVALTARGVQTLVGLLDLTNSVENSELVVDACAYLASLAHSRSGLKDAIVTAGGLDRLVELLLESDDFTVRSAASVVLGYLTFNRTAARLLLKACRENPRLFHELEAALPVPDARICEEFVADFRAAEKIGLPCQFMEKNGGHPILPSRAATAKTRPLSRAATGALATATSAGRPTAAQLRAKSAPAAGRVRPGSRR